MSSGSSMAAFGSWSTRWSSRMLERWCAQPPPTHHHPLATPPQLAADILVPVRLQEAAGPCKGVVMTQEAAGGAVHASPGSTWRTRLLHTVGRERCSRWRVLACGCACVLCHVSRLRRYIGVKTATSLPRTHCRVRALVSSAVAVPFGPSLGSRVLECRRALSFWPHAAARTPGCLKPSGFFVLCPLISCSHLTGTSPLFLGRALRPRPLSSRVCEAAARVGARVEQ